MKKMLVGWMVILVLMVAGASFVKAGDLDPNFIKTYEASKGTVTFNHTVHSTTLPDCRVCHSTEIPETIEVTKDWGHKMCKGCHKESIATAPNSPVRCNGCHIK